VRDESADAHNRVVYVLRKFVADRLADFYVRLTDGRREARVMRCGARMWCELLLELGGFCLEVRLTVVVPNCADFALTRVL
jgi:hypothetical protein